MSSLKILELMPDLRFVSSVGDYTARTACVMSAAVAEHRLRNGEPIGNATDELDCVCPVLRNLHIARNDRSTSDAERREWAIAAIPRLLGTADPAATRRRGEAVARYAVRVIAPRAMRAAGLESQAAELESLAPDAPLEVYEGDAHAAAAVVAAKYSAAAVVDADVASAKYTAAYYVAYFGAAAVAAYSDGAYSADADAYSVDATAAAAAYYVDAAAYFGAAAAAAYSDGAYSADADVAAKVVAYLDELIELAFTI